MQRLARVLLALALCAVLRPATADELPIIQEIRVEGLERLTTDSVLYYAQLQPGQLYTDEEAQRDFLRLWETQFFENLWLEKEETLDGVILTYHVEERPLLSGISYAGNDKLLTEDIRQFLSEQGIEFREGTPFSPGDVERARALIRELLKQSGFRFGTVSASVGQDPDGGQVVSFQIDEGAELKVANISFEGNQAFDDDDLRGAFEKTSEGGLFCIFNKKCVFNEASLREDLENLRVYYLDRGYLNFNYGEPDVRIVEQGDERKVAITIPITEGEQYTVSGVRVEGNQAYEEALLLRLNQLQVGQPYNRSKMVDSREAMQTIYGIKGYFEAFIAPRPEPNTEQRTVEVVYDVTEGDIFHVHRIEFEGNTTTKDKVIRRQMRLQEGDLFNTALFERSLLRIYQLGYFAPPKPRIEPSAEDPTKLDVIIEVEEQARNDIRFGGGLSGVEGVFITAAFSTRNLFGTGNSLTVDVQTGANVENYRFAYTDPFVLDRPVSAGIDLFSQTVAYPQFDRSGRGGRASLGWQFADFWFGGIEYAYEDVSSEANSEEVEEDPDFASIYDDDRVVSSLRPRAVYSTIDNPTKPWRGLRQVLSFEYAGGFLGGTTNFYKPIARTTWYRPLGRRHGVALHAEGGYIDSFDDDEVPVFERFFLGGDRSIRGYPVLEISPRDPDDPRVEIGGNKYAQFNAEYQVRIADPLSVVGFFDAGNAYNDDEKIALDNLFRSTGFEVRFYTPLLQAPLRLIWAYKLDAEKFSELSGRDEPDTDFTFSIGTTF